MKKLLIVLSLFGFLASCNKNEYKSNDQINSDDQAAIKSYLSKKNLTAQVTPEGVHFIIEVPGTGNNITLSNTAVVNYKGYFLDDKEFDNSNGKPIEVKMDGTDIYKDVITGWKIGLLKFKKGGKGKIFIPSLLAYKRQGAGNIPPNTPIAFDIDVTDVK